MAKQVISYNEFTFPFSSLEYAQRPVYGEDRITLLGIEYEFRVSGWVTANTPANLRGLVTQMRFLLSQPRKGLLVQWEDDSTTDTMFSFGPGGDHAFGPFPGDLDIREFTGGLAAYYTWSVRTFRKDCLQGTSCTSGSCPINGPTEKVLSITTRYTYDVDAEGLTTRTISGKLVCTADGAPAGQYRGRVTPSLPVNFHRVRYHFDESEDKREMTFIIIDAERQFTLPKPVTSGNATITVRAGVMELMLTYALSGWFAAPPSVPKQTLVNIVGTLVQTYFPVNSPGFLFETMELSASVYESNRIDFTVVGSMPAGNAPGEIGPSSIVEAATASITATPPNDAGFANLSYPYGGDGVATSGIQSPVPVIYDACNPASAPSSGTAPLLVAPPPTPGGTRSPGSSAVPPTSGISPEHQQAPYTAFHREISYEVDYGTVPFASKKKDAPIKVQQTHNPVLHIIDAGFAKRIGTASKDAPPPPKPISANSVPRQVYIAPVVAKPIGDGSRNEYTTRWRYVHVSSRAKFTLDDKETVKLPVDPRRPVSDPGVVENIPAELNYPSTKPA